MEVDGAGIDMWVRNQLLEITDGGLEGTPFASDHQRAIHEIARAVVEGAVTWVSTQSVRNGELWKERISFQTSEGPVECSTDFGTRSLFSGRARETAGRGQAYSG